MRAGFRELIDTAAAERRAVAAFTCYDASTAAGVLQAGAEAGTGVILLLAPAAFAHSDGPLRAHALAAMVAAAPGPACLQLDHAAEFDLARAAVGCGVDAVLADGSQHGLEANTEFVAASRAALGPEVGLEAELGHVSGDEDVALAAERGRLTDPEEAAGFAAATGIDCLAVSIGNVHGTYAAPPRLDWPRLERIHAGVAVPLALHGASGLDERDVRRAIALGVAKVNVNTELRERQFAALASRLPELAAGARMLELAEILRATAHQTARRLLTVLDLREEPSR